MKSFLWIYKRVCPLNNLRLFSCGFSSSEKLECQNLCLEDAIDVSSVMDLTRREVCHVSVLFMILCM